MREAPTTIGGISRPLTRDEAAQLLRRTVRSVDTMISRGDIKVTRLGRNVLVDPDSVAALLRPQT